jgi:hypothetical protein
MIQKSYEIQLFQGGTWRINTIFDDAELALFEARRMFESGLYATIRVVQEEFDDDTGGVTTRTIFKDAKVDKHNVRRVSLDASVLKTAMADRRKREFDKAERRRLKKLKRLRPMRLFAILFALAAMALGAMIGLQYVAQFL